MTSWIDDLGDDELYDRLVHHDIPADTARRLVDWRDDWDKADQIALILGVDNEDMAI